VRPVTVTRARSVILGALSIEVIVLVVTGAILYVAYVPTATQAFGPGFPDAEGGELAQFLRLIHRWAAWLAVPTSVTAAALLGLRGRPAERTAPGLAVGGGLVAATVAALLTGFLLPWNQIALSVVTVGGSLSGYTWLRDDDLLFVVIDGTEVAPSTLLKWLVLHVVVLGGATVALVALAWRRTHGAADPPNDADAHPIEVPAGV